MKVYTTLVLFLQFTSVWDFFCKVLPFQINTKLWVLASSVLKLVNKTFVILSSGHSLARDAVKKMNTGIRWADLSGGGGPSALGQVINGLWVKEGERAGSEGQLWPCHVPEMAPPAQGAVEVAGEPHGPCCSLPLHSNRSGNWGLTLSW